MKRQWYDNVTKQLAILKTMFDNHLEHHKDVEVRRMNMEKNNFKLYLAILTGVLSVMAQLVYLILSK